MRMFPRGMESFRISWFLVIFLLLACTLNTLSQANNEKKLPSTVVVGTVYCDTCFEAEISKNSHFISGASVAVECQKGSFRKEVKTNRRGKFRVHLPFSVSKHAKKIHGCTAKLIRSSEQYCAVASTSTSSSLHLKARKQGAHIFSAGFFTFKPQNQPGNCNKKPSVKNSKEFTTKKTYIPPTINPSLFLRLQDPTTPKLPTIPTIPTIPAMPNLPNLPSVPQLPLLPSLIPGVRVRGKKQEVKSTKSIKTTEFPSKKNIHPEITIELPPFPPTPDIPTLPPTPLMPPSTLPPNPMLPPPYTPLPPTTGIVPPNPLPPTTGVVPPNPLPPTPGVVPPNPLLPPPTTGTVPPTPTPGVVPPNPLLPPSAPGVIPPAPVLPPPVLPPNPVLPPPSPLPTYPVPLPPAYPGVPPASSSPKKPTP